MINWNRVFSPPDMPKWWFYTSASICGAVLGLMAIWAMINLITRW